MSNSSCDGGGIDAIITILGAGILIFVVMFAFRGDFGELGDSIADAFDDNAEYNQIMIDTMLYNKAKELNITITNEYIDKSDIILWFKEDALYKLRQADKLNISLIEELCSFSLLYNINVDKDIYQYKDTYGKDCFSNIINNDVIDILENGNVITQIKPKEVIGKILAIIVPVLLLIGGIILGLVLWIGGAYRFTNK